MPKALDLTGQRFGQLVAISKAPSKSGKTYWLCQCDCGKQKEVQTCHLVSGATKSCGCQAATKKLYKTTVFRQRIKISLVEAFGHKCSHCGLIDEIVVYDFHHINPKEKEFGLSSGTTTRSKEAYITEAKKCTMLCANCHRKIEAGLISANDFPYHSFNEQIYWDTLEKLKEN